MTSFGYHLFKALALDNSEPLSQLNRSRRTLLCSVLLYGSWMLGPFGNFDLLQCIKLDFADVIITKWRSRITGLSIVHIDYEGTLVGALYLKSVPLFLLAPIVKGYFVLGTESR